jgi:hypothetical protein
MLNQIKRIARRRGIEFADIIESPRPDKKYRIIFKEESRNGEAGVTPKPIDFGSKLHSNYLIHKDEERRQRWHARFKNNKGYNDPNSGLFYSRLLW